MMTFLLLLGGIWFAVVSVAILAFAAAAHRHQPTPDLDITTPHRHRLAPSRCTYPIRHRHAAACTH